MCLKNDAGSLVSDEGWRGKYEFDPGMVVRSLEDMIFITIRMAHIESQKEPQLPT